MSNDSKVVQLNSLIHSIALKGLYGLFLLTLACSCEKQVTSSVGQAIDQPIVVSSGSAYIQCEMGPFFLAHDSLWSCATEYGFDSLMTENWAQGCTMTELMVDSSQADVRMTYLEEGVLEIEGLNGDLNIQPFDLVLAEDSIDVNTPPFYGSAAYDFNGRSYSFVIVNRYIGGCFHDELIWEISE